MSSERDISVPQDTDEQLIEEREKVRKALDGGLQKGVWHLIDYNWFSRWKRYVNWDGNTPIDERVEPGQIDNQHFHGGFGDEVKRGIVEDVDYVVVPKIIGQLLFTKYGGGPQFPRFCENISTEQDPILKILLYPVRMDFYHCNTDNPYPTEGTMLRRYFHRDFITMDKVIDDMKIQFKLSSASYLDARLWVRNYRTPITEIPSVEGNRRMICDYTEFAGEWYYIRDVEKMKISEVLQEKEGLEIILEAKSRNFSESDYPRFFLQEAWKSSLKIGDLVDVFFPTNHWLEGVVKDVNVTTKDITIAYLGKDEESTEVIPHAFLPYRIKPLHARTKDRFKWKVDDLVHYRNVVEISDRMVTVEGLARIIQVDLEQSRVMIQFSLLSDATLANSSEPNPIMKINAPPPNSNNQTTGLHCHWQFMYANTLTDSANPRPCTPAEIRDVEEVRKRIKTLDQKDLATAVTSSIQTEEVTLTMTEEDKDREILELKQKFSELEKDHQSLQLDFRNHLKFSKDLEKKSGINEVKVKELEQQVSQLKEDLLRKDEEIDRLQMQHIPESELKNFHCLICTERRKNVVLVPCGHLCMCSDCSKAPLLKNCPLCRVSITRKQIIYI